MSYQTGPCPPERAPRDEEDTDAKNIRQRIIGVSERVYHIENRLAGLANNWWGPVPAEARNPSPDPIEPNSLTGIHCALDDLQALVSKLDETAARFNRLA